MRKIIVLTFLACLSSTAAPAGSLPPLPPINDGKSSEHHPGKVIWADLVTPDLAAAQTFYGGLFGWTFQNVRTGDINYAVATVDGRPVAGILQKAIAPGEQHHPSWLTFIAVRDVDRAAQLAVAHGAKSLSAAKTYGGRGRQEVLADPEGAVFAVLASSSGDPGDYLAAPGEWIWSSLVASDPARAADFYKAVFGYDVYDMPSDDGAAHVVLSSDDYARAGIHSLATDHHHPHWLNFVRVTSADDSAAKATTLGGRVLVEPYMDRHGGKIAIIADPTGAPLGLMEWADTETKAEPR